MWHPEPQPKRFQWVAHSEAAERLGGRFCDSRHMKHWRRPVVVFHWPPVRSGTPWSRTTWTTSSPSGTATAGDDLDFDALLVALAVKVDHVLLDLREIGIFAASHDPDSNSPRSALPHDYPLKVSFRLTIPATIPNCSSRDFMACATPAFQPATNPSPASRMARPL